MNDRQSASAVAHEAPRAPYSPPRQPSTFADLLGDRRDVAAGNDPVCADGTYAADVVSPLWPLTYDPYEEARTSRIGFLHALVRRGGVALRDALRNAREWIHRHREARITSAALHSLDDRTLRDLGFHRLEISSVAAELSRDADRTRRATLGAFAECP